MHTIYTVTLCHVCVLFEPSAYFLISSINDVPCPAAPVCLNGMALYDLPVPQSAAVDWASSHSCHNNQQGLATVVLPNKPADIEAGGLGAAGVWAGLQIGSPARPRPSTTGLQYLS